MELIERIGAYVGMAAFLGLAILALLYFSQARDVRRLREWAGRAPERAGEVAAAAARHALPPVTLEEAAQRPHKTLRERIGRIHIPHARYLALIVGAVVILGGAGLAAFQLVGDDESSPGSRAASADKGKRDRDRGGGDGQRKVTVDPGQVTVAVLNGTTVAGLAAQVGEEARANGFTLGTVTNAARTDQGRTVVMYRRGQKAAAQAIADRLGLSATKPVDPLSAELAGSFDVVVLVGADRAS